MSHLAVGTTFSGRPGARSLLVHSGSCNCHSAYNLAVPVQPRRLLSTHITPARCTRPSAAVAGCAPFKCAGRKRHKVAASADPNASQITASPASSSQGILPGSSGGEARLAPGTVVGGKYSIKEVLGAGATAVTYKAVTAEGADVAVKALSLRNLKDWKLLQLFQREAQTLQALNHPGIPRYLDYFEEDADADKRFYLVQELALGKSLEEIVLSGARATEEEVLRIAQQVLEVLQYLGELRPPVVHRDVKPENIVLGGGAWGGKVYLVDFGGVQRAALAGDALGSTIIGTYGYMAPEQFRGAAGPTSDVYSLGGTLLFLLSGVPPSSFPQERMRIAWEDKVTISSPLLSELLSGILEPLAEDRLSAKEALALVKGERPRGYAAVGPAGRPAGALAAQRQPAGTRVQISRSGNTFEMDIPPAGFTGNTVMSGAFAVAWNAFVAFWTVSALAGGGLVFALFSAPFWVAGVQLVRSAVGGSLTREALQIGRSNFKLLQELAMFGGDGKPKFSEDGSNSLTAQGSTRDLIGARVVTLAIVNGTPQTAIELVEGVNTYRFGEGLQPAEQEWIVSEVNSHLQKLAGGKLDAAALPPPPKPKVYNDDDDDDDTFINNRR